MAFALTDSPPCFAGLAPHFLCPGSLSRTPGLTEPYCVLLIHTRSISHGILFRRIQVRLFVLATYLPRMRSFWLLAGFVPLLAAQNASKGSEDQSLLWGTYRPNLYFGLRPRLPQSLMSGLMWWGTQDYASFSS
jgi:hypothetical protein